MSANFEIQQCHQKVVNDNHTHRWSFEIEEKVYVCNFCPEPMAIRSCIVRSYCPVPKLVSRHPCHIRSLQDHIRKIMSRNSRFTLDYTVMADLTVCISVQLNCVHQSSNATPAAPTTALISVIPASFCRS